MASEMPSAWAEAARCLRDGAASQDFQAVVAALDAARDAGRQEEQRDDLAADVTLRCGYGRQLGVYDGTDSPPCWDDIVDAARNEGRREREAEIVGWLRTDGPGSPADVYGSAVGGNEWTTAADAIERGAGRKERP